MRIPFAPCTTHRDQDLAVRLQFAALRRASDEARRTTPEHNRWIAPDTAHLLDSILASEARGLEATTPCVFLNSYARKTRVDDS